MLQINRPNSYQSFYQRFDDLDDLKIFRQILNAEKSTHNTIYFSFILSTNQINRILSELKYDMVKIILNCWHKLQLNLQQQQCFQFIIKMNIRLFVRFSTRKFYDIVEEKELQIMPQVPEDAVLSKYLALKQSAKNNQSKVGISKWQKQKSDKIDYTQLLNGNPHGSIQTLVHKNHQLTLISTNYFRIDEKKLHKVLFAAKPDAIVIQRRPQYHLHNFELLPKGNDGVFSDRKYLNQLKFSVEDIKPALLSPRPLVNALNKSKDDLLQKNPQKQVLQEKGFEICTKYTSSYKTPMYFAEMPMRSYRQWIANTHTLMQLQQIFKVVCQRLPRYLNLSLTPYQMATLIYPDIFLKLNDSYMATIIQMLIATKEHRKIVGIFGIVQNQAVKQMLQRNLGLKPVIDLLIPPGPKGTIVRDIDNLQIVEKHILLDLMFFGKQAAQIKTQFLHTTNSIIQMYAKQIEKSNMLKFRYEKTMEYIKLMEEKIKEGEEQIKKQFVRETLRSKE